MIPFYIEYLKGGIIWKQDHKNTLIISLIAIVFVIWPVGYAAFAQTLNINGSALYHFKMGSSFRSKVEQIKTTDSQMGTPPTANILVDGDGS